MLMNLEDIPVLVYKEFQAFIVEVRNKLHIYLIAGGGGGGAQSQIIYSAYIHYQKRLALVLVVQTDNWEKNLVGPVYVKITKRAK